MARALREAANLVRSVCARALPIIPSLPKAPTFADAPRRARLLSMPPPVAPALQPSLLERDRAAAAQSACTVQRALGTLFGVAAGLLFAVVQWRRSLSSSTSFDIFLSHHKGGAGNTARLMKLFLSQGTRARVFYDADNLNSLDLLFEAVRSSREIVDAARAEGRYRTAERRDVMNEKHNHGHAGPVPSRPPSAHGRRDDRARHVQVTQG